VRRFAVVAVLGLVGCTKAEPEPQGEDASPVAEATAGAAAQDPTRQQADAQAAAVEVQIAAREPPEVTVLVAGRNPREDLVLHPAVGTTEGIEIVTKTRMAMAGPKGKIPPTSVPPVVVKGRAIIERTDDKEIAFKHEVDAVEVRDDPDAPAGLVATLREQHAAFENYSAQLRVDVKGGLLGGTVVMPPTAVGPVQQTINQMTESFGQIQVPLPREPVGVGAKWRAEVSIDQAGLKVEQTVDYELLRREGDELFIAATVRQKLVDATFTPPGMFGVEAKVTRFESSGTGSMHLDLGHVVPTRSEIEMSIDIQLEMTVSDEAQTQAIAMVVGVAFSRT
jgi:hypothetical protein